MGIRVVPITKEPKKEKKQKGVKDMRAWVLNQLEKEGITANLNAPTGSLLDVLEATRGVPKQKKAIGGPVGYSQRWKTGRGE